MYGEPFGNIHRRERAEPLEGVSICAILVSRLLTLLFENCPYAHNEQLKII